MQTSDFDYFLPSHMIAQTPSDPRDSSRLMILDRKKGTMEHHRFHDLPDYLREGDLLLLNDTRVITARLRCHREDTGGNVELLLLHQLTDGVWKVLGKPARALRVGTKITIDGSMSGPISKRRTRNPNLSAVVVEESDGGLRTIRFQCEESALLAGHTPLPPYIHRPLEDPERYQTIYSRVPGSTAAPTAGLHFTPNLLETLRTIGVRTAYLTLHIGADTFRPVRDDNPRKHKLDGEAFTLGEAAASELTAARLEGRRIVAVGTTSVRLLEQVALFAEMRNSHQILPTQGWADLYILPGHNFRLVDAMITNFHLPRTTLLMLVSALAGRDLILRAYMEAIRLEYRFYSFGDCMIIV